MKRLFTILLIQIIFPVICFSQNHKIDSLLDKLKTAREDVNKIDILLHLRDMYFFYDLNTCADYNQQELTLSEKLNYQPGIITGYIYEAGNYSRTGDFKDALAYLNKAIPVIKQSGDKRQFAYLYNNLVNYYLNQGDYAQAMDYSNKALQKSNELNDSLEIAKTLETRAIVYKQISDYETSINYFLEVIKIFQTKHDVLQVSANYYNAGVLSELEHNNNSAFDYFSRALKLARDANSSLLIAGDFQEIGDIYMNEKKWGDALDYFKQAINANYTLEDSITVGDITRKMAMVYCEEGLFDKAIQAASSSIQIEEQTKATPDIGNSYQCLGEVYMKQKNYVKAITDLKKGLDIATTTNQKNNQSSIYKDLAICYEALNDYRSAYNYAFLNSSTNDTILNEESIKKTIEMGALFNSDKKDKEIALLTKNEQLQTKNVQIQTLQIKRQSLMQKSLIAGILLIIILFFFIYRNYHTRQLLRLQTLRNKIASDLHDDIGSTLSSISIFTLMAREGSKEVIPMLDQIGEYSRSMLDSMADIVWSINPNNDNFEKIILRMRSFAFDLLRSKNIDFEFDADESLDTMEASMELRKNLYLIFKEATNNMAKYSEASSAMFSITRTKNTLTLLIRDNGKGFDLNKENHGNGLKNMKNRAKEIGAKFLIESEPGIGTTIQLLIKAA